MPIYIYKYDLNFDPPTARSRIRVEYIVHTDSLGVRDIKQIMICSSFNCFRCLLQLNIWY